MLNESFLSQNPLKSGFNKVPALAKNSTLNFNGLTPQIKEFLNLNEGLIEPFVCVDFINQNPNLCDQKYQIMGANYLNFKPENVSL